MLCLCVVIGTVVDLVRVVTVVGTVAVARIDSESSCRPSKSKANLVPLVLTEDEDSDVLASVLFLAWFSSLSSIVGNLDGARKGLSSGFLASMGLLVVDAVSPVVVCTSLAVSGECEVWKENEDLIEVWICLFCGSESPICEGVKKEKEVEGKDGSDGRGDGKVEAGRDVDGLKVVTGGGGGGLGRIIILLSSLILTPSTSA